MFLAQWVIILRGQAAVKTVHGKIPVIIRVSRLEHMLPSLFKIHGLIVKPLYLILGGIASP